MPNNHLARLLASIVLAGYGALSAPLVVAQEASDPPGRVGVVTDSEGQVSLEPASTDTWIADVRNRPLGVGDRLWSDENSRAEVKVGSTTLHLAARTGIEFLALNDSQLQVRLSAGTLQLHVRRLDAGQALELDTAAGAVTVLRPGAYRLDVDQGADDLRVEVVRGQAEVATDTRSTMLEAGQRGEFGTGAPAQTTSLTAPDDFDTWAAARDQRDDRAVAARYVSADVPGYSTLDDYGDWADYPTYGAVWLPRVAAGFVPYRDGHWQWIAPWGWTWIDSAPWGFVPFHYGRWVNLGGRWGWCPGPVGHRGYFSPALVGWIGGRGWSENYVGRSTVGWFPLGWNEAYLPGYRASANYARELNLANTQLTPTYLRNNIGAANYRAGSLSNATRFANQQVYGAVTIVPREAFTGAAPVAMAARGLAGMDLTRAPAQTTAPTLAVDSRAAPGARVVGGPPNPSLWSRPVLARLAPATSVSALPGNVRNVTTRSIAPAAASAPHAPNVISGGVARAYADRPPYASRPAVPSTSVGAGRPQERARADRPWSARPPFEAAPSQPPPPREFSAPTYRGSPSAERHVPAPQQAPAHGGGAVHRMAAPRPWAALPHQRLAAYHGSGTSHTKHSHR